MSEITVPLGSLQVDGLTRNVRKVHRLGLLNATLNSRSGLTTSADRLAYVTFVTITYRPGDPRVGGPL